jgi:hypothetical protein
VWVWLWVCLRVFLGGYGCVCAYFLVDTQRGHAACCMRFVGVGVGVVMGVFARVCWWLRVCVRVFVGGNGCVFARFFVGGHECARLCWW